MSGTVRRELPPYARVVADIRARITRGEFKPGDRVPSTREISREWAVAMATATKALAALRQEGLVEAVRGVGTVVRGRSVPALVDAAEPQHSDVRRERPRRAREGGSRGASEGALTRAAIVQAAVTVADVEGVEGLSMRRIATELRVSTMALYRHVADKEELLTAMMDKVYQEAVPPQPPPTDWRQALELAMLWEWGAYRRHPWAAQLPLLSGPVLPRGPLANLEWMMSVVTDQGHSADTALEIVTMLSAFTIGLATQATQTNMEENELGLEAKEWWQSKAVEFLGFAGEGEFPIAFSVSAPPDLDKIFARGMECLLDGLALRIAPKN